MNNSKKLKTKKEKKDKLIEQKPITMKRPWVIVSLVLIAILISAILFDRLYQRVLVTIDDEKYHMDDLSYYFYTLESQYDYYNQIFGGSSWDMTFDEETGATMRDVAKNDAVDMAVYTEVLYKEAVKEGYSLTEEEKQTVSDNVDTLFGGQITEAVIKKNNFTKSYLRDVLSKSTLVERFRQDKINAMDIDDEGIKAAINYDEYRQYDIEYLFISPNTQDADGNPKPMGEVEKTDAYNKISSYYESAKATEDWSTLIPEEEEQLTYRKTNFLESSTTFSDEMEAMMMAMDNGAISEIYEAEDGYYIVRMINNNSSAAYDSAVTQAITTEENTRFDSLYEDEIKVKYDIDLKESAIRALTMGNLTLAY